ncbi:MAG: hypothetical protein ACJ77N_17000, partial [Chloroflexota bacterium]
GRAFMRQTPILILDEPTSALDPQAEWELFGRLRRLAHGRTAVYISHRFSTVRQADRIFFLEHGALVEQGTHEELLALGGRYARLFTLQASAYTGVRIADEALIEATGEGGSNGTSDNGTGGEGGGRGDGGPGGAASERVGVGAEPVMFERPTVVTGETPGGDGSAGQNVPAREARRQRRRI